MIFKEKTIKQLATLICGNTEANNLFPYRSSSKLNEFFRDIETSAEHRGETRVYWVGDVLKEILMQPKAGTMSLSNSFIKVIQTLMDPEEKTDSDESTTNIPRIKALSLLNETLHREGYEAYYAEDGECYLKNIKSGETLGRSLNPHRPLSAEELKNRTLLINYLDKCSEDELILEVILPLLRQLGFQRITSAGHKDKALEYGKDIWMRYALPTQHILYFGIQAKKGKLDSSGATRCGNANVAEIYNQCLMMLGHEIFDPEINRKVLVDHAFIVAGGEITKQARNWLGGKLDAQKRSQIMFMDREDILNLFVVSAIPLPCAALPANLRDRVDNVLF